MECYGIYNQEHNQETQTDDSDEVDPGVDYDEDAESAFDEDSARSDLRCHAAEFLLCAKEHAKITQTTLDMVKDSTKALLGEYFDVVRKSLTAKLKDDIQ